MRILSWLFDRKIKGLNASVEMSVEEYWGLAKEILEKNELQRKKVRARGKPYQLLRRDLLDGCIMPPIILAVSEEYYSQHSELVRDALESGITDDNLENAGSFLEGAVSSHELIILDGLQRTYTIGECVDDAKENESLGEFNKQLIRTEIYVGLSKIGILYRMLTLNTGQTPMSFRHQIEILYNDYIDRTDLPNGIRVLREVDDSRARGIGSYKYSDIVDMFYAYTTGKSQSLDRRSLVNKLSEMDFLEEFSAETEDLWELLIIYHRLVQKISALASEWKFDQDDESQDYETRVERPFGKDVSSVFEKVQPMTAFGAVCNKLKAGNVISSLSDLESVIDECEFSGSYGESLSQLIVILDQIQQKATKIGVAQREFFQHSFLLLLNPVSDFHKDLSSNWLEGQSRYSSLEL